MTTEMVKGIARDQIREVSDTVKSTELQTTDATATVLMTIDTQDYENGIIRYSVLGLQDDGATGLAVERVLRYVNDSSTLTLSSEVDILNENDLSGSVIASNVNGATIEIKVTGIAATNISWIGKYEQFNQIAEVLAP